MAQDVLTTFNFDNNLSGLLTNDRKHKGGGDALTRFPSLCFTATSTSVRKRFDISRTGNRCVAVRLGSRRQVVSRCEPFELLPQP